MGFPLLSHPWRCAIRRIFSISAPRMMLVSSSPDRVTPRKSLTRETSLKGSPSKSSYRSVIRSAP